MELSFVDFMKRYKLENAATSNVKISEVINKLGVKDFNIYMGNDKLTTKQGIINMHTTKGTHWVCYIINNKQNKYFDSYGQKPNQNIAKQLKPLIYSTYKIQSIKNDNKCAAYCLYILYLVNVRHYNFEKACTSLYYQSQI
jgi:hypothetical protein